MLVCISLNLYSTFHWPEEMLSKRKRGNGRREDSGPIQALVVMIAGLIQPILSTNVYRLPICASVIERKTLLSPQRRSGALMKSKISTATPRFIEGCSG